MAGSPPGKPESRGRRVRSAERVAAVLDLLRRTPGPLRHGDVAREIGLPKSTTTNLLDTLAEVGLVARDEHGYSLGVKLIELGAAAAERLDIHDLARPVLRDLSELGIGTANLAILQGHDVLYIEKVNNPEHLIQIATRVGGTVPAHTTALGKVLVAALPGHARERWLREHVFTRITEHTITSPAEFENAVAFAAANGYALDDEESNLRAVCIAAPIRDHTGAVVAAMSLTCLSVDVQNGRDTQVAAVIEGAVRVSELLGGTKQDR
jgi:DNA-binding IclR family transcriptional regulator